MPKALFRFFQLSCVSFVTSFGLTLALHEWGQVPEEAAFAVALAVVLILNFVGMRWYIYEAQSGTILQQFGLYLCSAWGVSGCRVRRFSRLAYLVRKRLSPRGGGHFGYFRRCEVFLLPAPF